MAEHAMTRYGEGLRLGDTTAARMEIPIARMSQPHSSHVPRSYSNSTWIEYARDEVVARKIELAKEPKVGRH